MYDRSYSVHTALIPNEFLHIRIFPPLSLSTLYAPSEAVEPPF